jgi:hypothetical protein
MLPYVQPFFILRMIDITFYLLSIYTDTYPFSSRVVFERLRLVSYKVYLSDFILLTLL